MLIIAHLPPKWPIILLHSEVHSLPFDVCSYSLTLSEQVSSQLCVCVYVYHSHILIITVRLGHLINSMQAIVNSLDALYALPRSALQLLAPGSTGEQLNREAQFGR